MQASGPGGGWDEHKASPKPDSRRHLMGSLPVGQVAGMSPSLPEATLPPRVFSTHPWEGALHGLSSISPGRQSEGGFLRRTCRASSLPVGSSIIGQRWAVTGRAL